MKKQIAFLGEPWYGSMVRLESFMMSNPEYDYSFINANLEMNKKNMQGEPDHPFEFTPNHFFKSRFFHDFDPSEFDLILTLNDKFFDKVLTANNSSCPNLTDKLILSEATSRFGFDKIETENFNDSDIVFVKPIIGAGQYAFDNLCYKKFQYDHIKNEINAERHIVQHFINSPLFTFVSSIININGQIEIMDVSQAYHTFDYKDVSLNCHLESKSHELELYTENIELTKEFLTFTGFTSLPGIYMCQFTTQQGQLSVIDFNVRTGPISDFVTLNNLYTARVQNNFSFIVENKPIKRDVKYPDFRCYLEKNGKILSPLVKNPDFENRKRLIENKTSGLIRNDYETYLEIKY